MRMISFQQPHRLREALSIEKQKQMNCLLIYSILSSSQVMAEFQTLSPAAKSRMSLQSSPGRYEFDFQRRKLERLESQMLVMGEQLNKARVRLRRAQDFQIKFEMVINQKTALEEELIMREKDLYQLRARNEQMGLLLKEEANKNEEGNLQKLYLLREAQEWKERALEAEDRARFVAVHEQEKAKEKVQKELLTIERNFTQAQEEYRFQISLLKKQLHQKAATQNIVSDKQERGRKEKQAQIVRLERALQKGRDELLETVAEKNKEIERVRLKFQQIYNDEIGHLQKNMTSQDNRFGLELQGLRALLQLKGDQISSLQEQLKITLQNNTKDRSELLSEIRLFKQKLYERQRTNEEELMNLKERLTKLHSLDIQTVNLRYQQLIDGLKKDRSELERLLKERDSRMESELKQFQRGRQQLQKKIVDRERSVQQLRQRKHEVGSSSSTQIGKLQQVLTQVQNDKQRLSSEYQTNITFLNQQITKLINSNQLKNNQIRELHEYNALLKKQQFEALKQLELKWKNQRKEREMERQKQRDLRQKVEQDFREKEKVWRHREREIERQIEKERREKAKLIVNLQQLEKQLQRTMAQKKSFEELYIRQLGKGQQTVLGAGGARRELANQVQKQRVEIEAVKRMEVEQVRKKYQLELTRLNNSNERLQSELASKNIAYQNLQEELKKLTNQNRNIQKINKEKLANYHKKMATLNSEILLTQNLYQSFIDAKSRVVRGEQ